MARPTRRGLFLGVAGAALTGGTPALADGKFVSEPFWGAHQAGITTPAQAHTYAAAFDLVTGRREQVADMLRTWTAAAASLCRGEPAPSDEGGAVHPGDSGETLGAGPARLTLTFGFGAGLFVKNNVDRYGLAAQRPPALVDLPQFKGDELAEARTGGDLFVQACADDPQVAFHAVRQLARIGRGVAEMRWAQSGFLSTPAPGQRPRNLMGFKDGSNNLRGDDTAAMDAFVWVGEEGPAWVRGGSYLVLRRIRIALEHWDRMPLDFQEQTFGRRKYSGAPLGGEDEIDPPDLAALRADGEPVIPESAHIRLAAAASNGGAKILRRPYGYNDGVALIKERWPPWREGLAYDAGLLFVCYQRDPRTGFIRIFERLSQHDMLNQFVTHTGGGLFACPPGAAPGEYVGQRLFEPGKRTA
ncbi:MAG TPA: Dyp-type peroxidase [Stellaceae bacterium]|nr:Dyp-type peroxidase [Stellaceae bacterium]